MSGLPLRQALERQLVTGKKTVPVAKNVAMKNTDQCALRVISHQNILHELSDTCAYLSSHSHVALMLMKRSMPVVLLQPSVVENIDSTLLENFPSKHTSRS